MQENVCFFVMCKSLQTRNQEGAKPSLENFRPHSKNVLTYFETIGHSFKRLSLS